MNEKRCANILVMGIGNYLMGDEGVGVHIAQEMEKQLPAGGIDILDAGTGGFSLMGYFDDYAAIIIVDATMDGSPPGTLKVITPKFSADFPKALSTHDIGLKDMIDLVYMKQQVPMIRLITISIPAINPMTVELSPEVQNCIPNAIEKIIKLSEEMAITLQDKEYSRIEE